MAGPFQRQQRRSGVFVRLPPGVAISGHLRCCAPMKFDFPISMGVRYGDKARKAKLNELIDRKSEQIKRILLENHVPLVDENGRLL